MSYKRPNECLFCTSRRCHYHIYSSKDEGASYNEIACNKHIWVLEEDADWMAPGVMKQHLSSSSFVDRRILK
jgi:hypothetical protein